jgi:hypothetical protein
VNKENINEVNRIGHYGACTDLMGFLPPAEISRWTFTLFVLGHYTLPILHIECNLACGLWSGTTDPEPWMVPNWHPIPNVTHKKQKNVKSSALYREFGGIWDAPYYFSYFG